MTALLILACITVVALGVLLALQAWAFTKAAENAAQAQRQEQQLWREERRFLIDRAIARHVGEIVALEREDQLAKKAELDAAAEAV